MLKILLEAKMFLRSVIPQSLQDYLPGRGMRVDSLATPWEENETPHKGLENRANYSRA